MAKKIEGSIHPTEVQRITTDGYEDATVYTTPAKGEYVSAVLVIGEKAFTESEVRALMGPMTSLARNLSQPEIIREVEYVQAQDVQQAFDELKAIVVRLGLYSDPAYGHCLTACNHADKP